MKLLFFILGSAHLFAADVDINVFSLFHPPQLVLQAFPGQPLSVEVGGVREVISTPLKIDLTTGVVQISEPAEFRLGVPGKIDRRFFGRLRITAVGKVLVPVVYMSLETATAGAVAAEMPADAPPSALAAMAVLARSFYSAPSTRHQGFAFCDTTHCQFNRGPAGANSRASSATR